MSFFRKRNPPSEMPALQSVRRSSALPSAFPDRIDPAEYTLYSRLRCAVPILDAALQKIIRLTGCFTIRCSDSSMQEQMDAFVNHIPTGCTTASLQSFADMYLDSLLTWGNALGELCIEPKTHTLTAVICADPAQIIIRPNAKAPDQCSYYLRSSDSSASSKPLAYPERILFTALNPPAGHVYGVSILRGLPALSNILLRIYECIGQNYDRMGNIRYAVTYRPSNDPSDRAYAGERARTIAREWCAGMQAAADGEVRDFICAGDVDIKVIGAESQLLDTEIPVRQILEQIIAKLSIPPFLLGLNWSSTERMSTQQADILTSELEYYRRLLSPVLYKIACAFLRLCGSDSDVIIEWSNINLQDETALAQARLANAQALEIEQRCANFDTSAI